MSRPKQFRCPVVAWVVGFLVLLLTWMVTSTFAFETESKPASTVHPPGALEIGAEAPDIEGEDIEGVKFKLSDYRGKVVVLDFWGDW